jgi:hypothetical protein
MKKKPDIRIYLPIDQLAKPSVDTQAAAYYMNRAEQTMRYWACSESGPIRPLRIHGRLHWPVAEIRRLLGVEIDG